MAATISITEANVLTVLRSFLVSIMPADVEVVAGQDNRVPEPKVADFITMTPIGKVRLSTNIDNYTDPYPLTGVEGIMQPTQFTIQLDVHGPNSSDNSEIITTLVRDDYGVTQFQSLGAGIEPLYAEDPRQVPFINAEQQYEDRWVFSVVLQYNPITQVTMQFFTVANLNLVDVDVTYKP